MDKFVKIIIILVLVAVIAITVGQFGPTILKKDAVVDRSIRLLDIEYDKRSAAIKDMRTLIKNTQTSIDDERKELIRLRKEYERLIREKEKLGKK